MQAYRASRGPTLRSAENLRNKYGMTPDEYDALLTAQNGRCAICDRLPSDNARHGRLYVDHHHASGKVRGLLCDQCNRAIGLLQDSPDVIMAAAAYLLTRQIEAPLKEAPNA